MSYQSFDEINKYKKIREYVDKHQCDMKQWKIDMLKKLNEKLDRYQNPQNYRWFRWGGALPPKDFLENGIKETKKEIELVKGEKK